MHDFGSLAHKFYIQVQSLGFFRNFVLYYAYVLTKTIM